MDLAALRLESSTNLKCMLFLNCPLDVVNPRIEKEEKVSNIEICKYKNKNR